MAKRKRKRYPAGKYPKNWQKVSATIRRLANGRCEWCGRESSTLAVHHIGAPYPDGRPGNSHDKHDLRRENLAAVCFKCHDAVDCLRKVRASKQRQRLRRQARFERHRSLGIGTGLVVYERIAA